MRRIRGPGERKWKRGSDEYYFKKCKEKSRRPSRQCKLQITSEARRVQVLMVSELVVADFIS